MEEERERLERGMGGRFDIRRRGEGEEERRGEEKEKEKEENHWTRTKAVEKREGEASLSCGERKRFFFAFPLSFFKKKKSEKILSPSSPWWYREEY